MSPHRPDLPGQVRRAGLAWAPDQRRANRTRGPTESGTSFLSTAQTDQRASPQPAPRGMTHKGTRPLRAGALCSAHHRQGVARVWLPADQQYGCLEWLDRSPSIKDVDQTPARIIGTIGEAQYGYDDDDPTALPLVTIDFLLSRALTSTERRYLSAWAVGDPRLDRVSFPPTEPGSTGADFRVGC